MIVLSLSWSTPLSHAIGQLFLSNTSTAHSGTQRCFEFVLSPLDRVIEPFAALRELGYHLASAAAVSLSFSPIEVM
jgi:hypothetical protein